jgi:hypothetical protein
MAKCKHENVRVYVERSFTAQFEDGKLSYNPDEPDHEEIVEVLCSDCDETIENYEVPE